MIRFLIVCQSCTGSKLLTSLLDSHPEITCLFEPRGIGNANWPEALKEGTISGADVKYPQVQPDMQYRSKIVHLRRDPIDRTMSVMLKKGKLSPDGRLDPMEFRQLRKAYEAGLRWWSRTPGVYQLDYETILGGHEEVSTWSGRSARDLLHFLGAQDVDFKMTTHHTRKHPMLRSRVANRRALGG